MPEARYSDSIRAQRLGRLSSWVEVVLSVVSQQSVSTEYTWGIIRDLPIHHKAGAGAGLLVDPTIIWLQIGVYVEYPKGLLQFHHSRNEINKGMEQHRFRSCDIAQWLSLIHI